MSDHSQLLSRSIGIIYPIILIFGLYVIFNGHVTPGGGFQGGAIIGATMIAKYLADPIPFVDLEWVQSVEKGTLLTIYVLAALFCLVTYLQVTVGNFYLFMIISNILIGLKVACGMTIIINRFVYFETR